MQHCCLQPSPTVSYPYVNFSGHKGEPTVGTPQQQLGFLFSRTQVAFMYDYKYRVEWTLLERPWFVLPTNIKYVSKQKNV